MARKSKRQRKHKPSFVQAPRGMIQQVSTWDLNEAYVIPFPAGAGNEAVDVKINAGVNSWGVETFYTGGTPAVVNRLYGSTTGQFDKLAGLWATYRIKSVELQFTPSTLAGVGSSTPIISIIDVASAGGDFPEQLQNFSKSRTLQLTSNGFANCTRRIDYHNWLAQALDHPYLRTIINGNREVYQADGIDRVPAIQMQAVYKVNSSQSSFFPYLGIVRIRTTYEFRGRRLDDEEIGVRGPQIMTPLQFQQPQSQQSLESVLRVMASQQKTVG